MMRLARWWRRGGGLLAACLLVLFAAGPVLDPIICREDRAPAAAGQMAAATVLYADADHRDQSSPDGGVADDHEGLCLHGHCHHVTPHVAPGPILAAHLGAAGAAHDLHLAVVPTSELQFGLKRPPRA